MLGETKKNQLCFFFKKNTQVIVAASSIRDLQQIHENILGSTFLAGCKISTHLFLLLKGKENKGTRQEILVKGKHPKRKEKDEKKKASIAPRNTCTSFI